MSEEKNKSNDHCNSLFQSFFLAIGKKTQGTHEKYQTSQEKSSKLKSQNSRKNSKLKEKLKFSAYSNVGHEEKMAKKYACLIYICVLGSLVWYILSWRVRDCTDFEPAPQCARSAVVASSTCSCPSICLQSYLAFAGEASEDTAVF